MTSQHKLRFKVVKCGYSRKPWRIIDTSVQGRSYQRGYHPEGIEVWVPETLGLMSGPLTVQGPLGFDRRRDALEALRQFEGAA